MDRSIVQTGNWLVDQLSLQVQNIPEAPAERAAWVEQIQSSLQQLSAERERLQSGLAQAQAELEHSRAACQIMQGENERLRGRLAGQREVEAAVYQRAEEFRGLAEHSPNGVLRLDRELRHLYVNPALERMCGLSREVFLHTPAPQLWVYHPAGELIERLRAALETGQASHLPSRLNTVTGECWFDVQIVPEPVSGQPAESLLVVARDITEDYRREEALRRAADRLRVATARAGFVVFEQDLNLVYTWVYNPHSELVENVVGKSDAQLFPEAEAAALMARKRQVLNSAQGMRSELTLTVAGQQHIYDTIFEPQFDENGQVCRLLGSLLDITERRKAEQELAYRAHLLENVHDAIVATNQQLQITSWNHAAEALYGWSESEVIGRSVYEILPSEYEASTYSRMLDASQQADPFRIELAQRSRDGRRLTVECHVLALYDDQHNLSGFVTANRDITWRVQLEEETNRQRKLLEAIFESHPGGLAVVSGPDLVFQTANPAYRLITPHPEIDPLGRRMVEIWPLEDGFDGTSLMAPVIEEDASVTIDQVERTYPDGQPRTFTLHIRPLHWRDEPAALLVVWETTELERALNEAHNRAAEAEESQRLLQALMEYVPEGVIIASAPLVRNLYVSRYMAALGGFQPEDQRAPRNWQAFRPDGLTPIPPEELPTARSAHGEVLVDEELIVTRGETRAHLLVSAAPIRDNQGQIFASVAVARDITDRKRAEAHQRFLTELGKALVTIDSPDTVRADVSERLGRYLGLSRCFLGQQDPESGQQHVAHDYHPNTRSLAGNYHVSKALPEVVRLLEQGRPVVISDLLAHPLTHSAQARAFFQPDDRAMACIPLVDRAHQWVGSLIAIHNHPHTWLADELNLLNGVADLTRLALENARLLQDLRDTNARFELALRTAPIGVYTVDRDLRVTWAFNTRFPRPPGQVIGRRVEEVAPPQLSEPVIEMFQNVFEEGLGRRQVFEVPLENGETIYLDISAEPLRAPEEAQISGLSVALVDVTEQRRMQAERIRDQAHIELQGRLIQERETERTRIARELHDGPLQELIATNFALVEAMDIDEHDARLAKMRQVQALLVRQVQELRRFCNELRPPVLGPFGLEKTIRSHVESLRQRYPALRFHLELDKDGHLLPEDLRLTLFRIFQELVNNVLRHSNASQVIIRFRLGDQQAMLEVEDNGSGFQPPNDWLDLARQGHLGRVGLRERVQIIGGQVQIDASPGQGTRIQVTTPR